MESKFLAKSTNNIVASRFFAHTLSRIRWIVKLCDVVDLFLWKLFWFFLSMFSILDSKWLHSRALYILAATGCKGYTLVVLGWSEVALGKRRMHPFVHLSIVFWLYTALQYQSSISSNSLVFHTFGSISSSPLTSSLA